MGFHGLMTSTTDRLGRRRDFQYDAVNHLTTEKWFTNGGTATETLTYSFDANGNKLTAKNSNGTYTMSYDAMNHVTVVQDMWGDTLTFTHLNLPCRRQPDQEEQPSANRVNGQMWRGPVRYQSGQTG